MQPVLPLQHLADPMSLAGVVWKLMPAAHPPERKGCWLCPQALPWAAWALSTPMERWRVV